MIPRADATRAIAPSPSSALVMVCWMLKSFMVSVKVFNPLIWSAKLPAPPINPTKLPNGLNTPDMLRLTSSQAAPSWSVKVLCSASSSANCCNCPSYWPVISLAWSRLPACIPRACSSFRVSPSHSLSADDKPDNAALPPPYFCVAAAIIMLAWSTSNPNSLNWLSNFRRKV